MIESLILMMNPGALRQCFGAPRLPFQSSCTVVRGLTFFVRFPVLYYTVFGTTLALMRSCVRSQELCARTMTMDAYQVKITLQSRAPNVDSNSLT